MAPGGDRQRDDNGDGNPDGVLSIVNQSDGSYAYYNGTSMATPHVAGVAALLLACDSTLTPAQVLARIQATALPRSNAQCPQACGAGLLNAMVAIPPGCGGSPPSGSLSLTLDPLDLNLNTNGNGNITATVTQSGAPKSGVTVTFSSDNPGIASVSPGSALTDVSGKAQVSVQGRQKGDTQVRAATPSGSAQSHVKVPSLSFWALALLVVAAGAIYVEKVRRERALSGVTKRAK
jgi:serine protease